MRPNALGPLFIARIRKLSRSAYEWCRHTQDDTSDDFRDNARLSELLQAHREEARHNDDNAGLDAKESDWISGIE